MGRRGPRPRRPSYLAVVPEAMETADYPVRPPVAWDRLVLTEAQAAEFLKDARSTLMTCARAGNIPHYQVVGEFRYYVYDLLDYALSIRSN